MNKICEDLLRSFYIEEGNDIIKYNKLSEDEKVMFTKDIVTKIVKSIEDEEYRLDNVEVNNSKGDITKLTNYRYIDESLNLLNLMQASMNESIPYLNVLNDSKSNLIKFTKDFEKGFKLNKSIIKIFYSNLVLSLIYGISFMIANSIDYVKDPIGNYNSVYKYNLKKNSDYPTISFECLDKFNLMSNNGEMQYFFNSIYTTKMNENVVTDVISLAFETVGDFGKSIVLILKNIPSIVDVLRLFVSMIYFKRVSTSDHLRLQAKYIELNVERLRNLENPNKKTIEKQEKIIRELTHLADKIDVDEKISTKNAKNEINQQNKKISKGIKENQMGNKDPYPIEEIIL